MEQVIMDVDPARTTDEKIEALTRILRRRRENEERTLKTTPNNRGESDGGGTADLQG